MSDTGLSERKKQILKAIVEAHISGGEPVGSKYIVENRQLACSSATIRNEMSELEEMGYLEKPHTSSGRVPSELGYRFYVDSLLQHYAMTAGEVAQINHLLKVKMSELDQILETASKLASNITNYTGFAIKPKLTSHTVSKFELVAIDERTVLLVMITARGAVKTKKLTYDGEVTGEALAVFSRALNEDLSGLGGAEITLPLIIKLENLLGADAFLVRPILDAIYETVNEDAGGDLRISGLNRLLQYPEFSDSERFGRLLTAIEGKEDILNLVRADADDVNVIIGSESSVKVMDNSSVIYKPIKKNGHTIGAIGVIGPLRMDYAKVLATVEELGDNIASLLDGNLQLTEGEKDAGKRED